MIRSDNGTHFTAKIVRDVLKALNITQRFGTIYHAASQGLCERMNATVKRKLAKVWHTSKLNWVSALPFVLMDIRNSVNRTTSFTPHLLLTGREMHKPMGPFNSDSPFVNWDKQHHSYVKMLQEIVSQLHKCRQRSHDQQLTPDPDNDILPGSWVYVKVHRRDNWTSPYQTGPHLITQSTERSVQVQRGTSKVWYHLYNCFECPADPTQRSLTQIRDDLVTSQAQSPDPSADGTEEPASPTSGAPEGGKGRNDERREV